MKRGDLVQLKGGSTFTLILFRGWGKVPGGMETIGHFYPGEVGILLEDLFHQGGNGCKVITSSGAAGWVYRSDVEVLQ